MLNDLCSKSYSTLDQIIEHPKSQNKSVNEDVVLRCSAQGVSTITWWLRDTNNNSMEVKFISKLDKQAFTELSVENGFNISTLKIMLVESSIGTLNESHIHCRAVWLEDNSPEGNSNEVKSTEVNSSEAELLIQGTCKQVPIHTCIYIYKMQNNANLFS